MYFFKSDYICRYFHNWMVSGLCTNLTKNTLFADVCNLIAIDCNRTNVVTMKNVPLYTKTTVKHYIYINIMITAI